MSEPAVEPVDTQGPVDQTQDTGVEQEAPQEVDNGTGLYDKYLEKLPTSFHPIAVEAFKEWDANTTKRFQELHSTYEPYKPFVDEWEPEAITQALAIAQALEADPEDFYQRLAKAYGFAGEQGSENQQQNQQVVEPDYDENDPYLPQLKQHEELLRTLADHIIGQETATREAQEAAENRALLDSTLSSLKEKHGEYDEQYVLNALANGVDPEAAVLSFKSMVSEWAAKQNAPTANAPRVMGGGNGSIPSNQVDPAKLSRNETKNLVEQYLKSANGG